MNRIQTKTWCGMAALVSAFALAACSSDSGDGDSGGEAGTSSATGGTAADGTGGSADGAGGSGDAAGGTDSATGGAGSGDDAGVAVLFVPLAAENTSQEFEIYLAEPTDLTGVTITWRVMTSTAGTAGGIQLAAKNGAPNYEYYYASWTNIPDAAGAWTDISLDLSQMPATASLDPSAVAIISLQVAAGAAWEDGSQVWADTTVYVDSVTFSGGPLSPYTFDADATALNKSTWEPIDGSTVTWAANAG